jgi:hypothetical protein
MTATIVYPPRHPEKKHYDPTSSYYWQFFSEEERHMLRNHPRQEVKLEIQLMRFEIGEVLKAQQKYPCTTPQETLAALYAISVAARTIGTLVKLQSDYKQTHHKWDERLAEAKHISLIRMGVYRQVAAQGFAVPEGVLEIEPDLMPKPLSYSESLIVKARQKAEFEAAQAQASQNTNPPSAPLVI